MKLWRRASGVLKDTNSIIAANLTRRTSFRNPDVEAAVIKATSHDDATIDLRNCQRIYKWIADSPSNVPPFAYAIAARIDKTRSWVVALKGLILIHGVFCLRVPAVLKVGRLPFDLSHFMDSHDDTTKTWAYNAFVRAYYAFLDQKSGFMASELQELRAKHKRQRNKKVDLDLSLYSEIERLQTMQTLVDMLMQVKPPANEMVKYVVLEAMDCCLTEMYDINSRISHGIDMILKKISSGGIMDASLALKVVEKSNSRADELSLYIEFCRGQGILSSSVDCPEVKRVPREDIRKMEKMINGDMDSKNRDVPEVVVKNESNLGSVVVTTNWVVFDDEEFDCLKHEEKDNSRNPFESPPTSPHHPAATCIEIPDMISFS